MVEVNADGHLQVHVALPASSFSVGDGFHHEFIFAVFTGESRFAGAIVGVHAAPAGAAVHAGVGGASRVNVVVAIWSCSSLGTLAGVVIALVYAVMALRARIWVAHIHFDVAIFPCVATCALARVFTHQICTCRSVSARHRNAFVVLNVAVNPGVPLTTVAFVSLLSVHANAVNAGRRLALVQAVLTLRPGKPFGALAFELRYVSSARSPIKAWH